MKTMENEIFIGYSENLDFTEALKDAIAKMPPPGPDMLLEAKIVEISYSGGGGFSGQLKPKLCIKVESNYAN